MFHLKLGNARDAIDSGDYDSAISACEAILAYTPTQGGGGAPSPTTPPGGITGFFIAVGDFAMNNLVWILLASATGIVLFLGRKRIIEFFRRPPAPPAATEGENNESSGESEDDTKIYTILW